MKISTFTSAVLLSLASCFAHAQYDYTLAVLNTGKEVSPSGELKIEVRGPSRDNGSNIHELYFDADIRDVVEVDNSNIAEWGYFTSLSNPRFLKFRISETAQINTTVNLRAYRSRARSTIVGQVSFEVKSGQKGHHLYKGQYVQDIVVGRDSHGAGSNWFEIVCINNTSNGGCRINIKNDGGEFYKYTGKVPKVAQHRCGDSKWPFGSTLTQRESYIFDARTLLQYRKESSISLQDGFSLERVGVCRIASSNGRIVVRPIADRFVTSIAR